MSMKQHLLKTAEETIAFGKEFGKTLKPGTVIGLDGVLGAGKTTFTKGLALGLDVEEVVTSPTFTLLTAYEGRIPLYHFDLYRLNSYEEFEMIGGEEYLFGGGVSVIEWYKKFADDFADITRVEIAINEDLTRIITIWE